MIASNGAWGILGGTFDPVHNAHIRLAVHAYNELHLEKVIFIPAYIPPHKTDRTKTLFLFWARIPSWRLIHGITRKSFLRKRG